MFNICIRLLLVDFTTTEKIFSALTPMEGLPPELKIAIFEHLRKRDLQSSALVCRAWRDLAWDKVMWRTCTIRYSGLLEVLFGEEEGWWKFASGDSIPLTSDSNRFLALAAKTGSIHLDVTLIDRFVNVMMDVANSAPGKILFPALHTLDCGEFGDPQGDFAHTVFAGSPIKTIWIDGGHSLETTIDARRLLSSLLEAHPQLQHVTAYEGNLPEGSRIAEFWRLTDLRSLKYEGNITPGEWIKLIQECPRLNEVTIEGNIPDASPPNLGPHLAPSLRRLSLTELAFLDPAISMLESIEAPHLVALDFDAELQRLDGATEQRSASRARSAFRLLAERSKYLESLTLVASIEIGVENLGAFRSLRRLRVTDRTPGCQLDDSGMDSLCRSLPNLREFYLRYAPLHGPERNHARTTPKSLGSFSRYCKDITYLGLPVTATNTNDFVGSILTQLVAFPEILERLVLSALILPSDRTKDFVSFLTVQCPKLTYLDIYDVEISDQMVSRSTLMDIKYEMEVAYFRSRVAS
ncbi:hypothetical protein FRC01_008202 [Tulasnella sp. 417]|nr:hypothetical protein FRC01_008202 [Tulasnella sp. 417]